MHVRPGAYQKNVERSRLHSIQASVTGRDIAKDYPPPGDLKLRAACEHDLRLFCEQFFPKAFHLQWSEDHLRVIQRMEDVVLEGGLFALALPRASGKTTLAIRCALWALLYGHRRFVCLIGATEERARALLRDLKIEINYNDLLASVFRQVCYPIRRLENNGRRCIGQLFNGKETRIDWSDDRLTFPTMPDEACDGLNVSGYTVSVGGLTGALRGQSHTLLDGTIIRPEVVLLDDPQTRESAMSVSQSATRTAIIKGDVLGMAGPDREISAITAMTIIRAGDMADEMLDREKNPEWSGQLSKMVYSFPTNMNLWEEYRDIRKEEFQQGTDHSRSDAFYGQRQKTMDEGCILAWPQRKGKGSISAVQHAMNLFFRDERAFFSEYQNDPMAEDDARPDDLTVDQICAKINNHARGVVPIGSEHLTAFIDVQQNLLYYAVCAWEPNFTGAVIDYGTFPDQKRRYFSLADCTIPISKIIHAPDLEGQIFGALEALTTKLLNRDWFRDDGVALRISRLLIDSNWGTVTDVCYRYCRQGPFSGIVTPSHGKFIGASSNPMSSWARRPGERMGLNWRLRSMQQGKRGVRSVVFDSNYFKTFLHNRLSVPRGSKSTLTLFGDKPETHRLLADHLTAEYRVKVEAKASGREIDEWKKRPEQRDNHWLDCLAGCCVSASIQGVTLETADTAVAHVQKAKRVSFAELQKNKQQPGARP